MGVRRAERTIIPQELAAAPKAASTDNQDLARDAERIRTLLDLAQGSLRREAKEGSLRREAKESRRLETRTMTTHLAVMVRRMLSLWSRRVP